jgi:RND family efflux transporter MFP subunit
MKYTLIISSILITFLTVGCSKEKTPASEKSTPVKVTLATVQGGNKNNSISASGKIDANNNANISTRMMGFVSKLSVKVGQRVSKGQSLIQINSSDLDAKLAQVNSGIAQATAAYTNAKTDYERFKNLFNRQSASQKELDDMTTRYEMAKAGLESAQQMKREVQAQFAYSSIVAPFTGVVTNTFVKEGDMANPGMPLLSIESETGFDVIATVSEEYIGKVSEGMKANIVVKTGMKEYSGLVSEVSRSAKNTGGQYLVKIALTGELKELRSGMFVNAEIITSDKKEENVSKEEQVLIPTEAIFNQGELIGVYTASENNTALLRWIRVGKQRGNMTEVLSGLAPDEKIVLSHEGKIFNGASITQ